MGLFRRGEFYGKPEEALSTEIDFVRGRNMNEDFSRDVPGDKRLLHDVT